MTGSDPRMSTVIRAAVAATVIGLLVTGCTQTTDLERAQKAVDSRTEAVADAQKAYDTARGTFCNHAGAYVSALDRYGKIFTDQTATVGDVRTLGADLDRPADVVADSAASAVDAHGALVTAQVELTAAQADLDAVKAGSSTTTAPSTTTTSTTLLPAATVERVRTEQQELSTVLAGVDDQTPLVQAGQQVNAAAFALEVAWMRVLSEAGCLTSEQQTQAQTAVVGYTAALQTAMQILGYYDGAVDGIYGPATVTAVSAFQTANSLPATGYVDHSTAAAIQTALAAKGGKAAAQAAATTTAVQYTLKLAGFWNGPVDGNWTQALTDALTTFQKALGVPATGLVDTATLEAIRQSIANADAPSTTTPPPTTATPTTAAPTTAVPTTAVPTTKAPTRRTGG